MKLSHRAYSCSLLMPTDVRINVYHATEYNLGSGALHVKFGPRQYVHCNSRLAGPLANSSLLLHPPTQRPTGEARVPDSPIHPASRKGMDIGQYTAICLIRSATGTEFSASSVTAWLRKYNKRPSETPLNCRLETVQTSSFHVQSGQKITPKTFNE